MNSLGDNLDLGKFFTYMQTHCPDGSGSWAKFMKRSVDLLLCIAFVQKQCHKSDYTFCFKFATI